MLIVLVIFFAPAIKQILDKLNESKGSAPEVSEADRRIQEDLRRRLGGDQPEAPTRPPVRPVVIQRQGERPVVVTPQPVAPPEPPRRPVPRQAAAPPPPQRRQAPLPPQPREARPEPDRSWQTPPQPAAAQLAHPPSVPTVPREQLPEVARDVMVTQRVEPVRTRRKRNRRLELNPTTLARVALVNEIWQPPLALRKDLPWEQKL